MNPIRSFSPDVFPFNSFAISSLTIYFVNPAFSTWSKAKIGMSSDSHEAILKRLKDQILMSGMQIDFQIYKAGYLIGSESEGAGICTHRFSLMIFPGIEGFD